MHVFVALVTQHAMSMRHIVICELSGSKILFSPHYLINGTIFGKKVLNIKCLFWFSLQIGSESFFILWRTERDMIKNVYRSSCKVPIFPWNILIKVEFYGHIFEKYSNIKFNKNPAIGNRVVSCGTDGRTDRHEEDNVRFSKFFERF